MCGIIAGIAVDAAKSICNAETEKRVTELATRMNHRGPDDIGVLQLGHSWFGHTRLSIVSPTHGHQPLSDKAGTCHAVVNGEIYNHLKLKEELGLSPEKDLTTESDSEIILHGYKAWGVDVCDKLMGMFAFVVVTQDADGKRTGVLAARDKVGIKPLYMGKTRDGTEMVFSSELKGIADQCDPKDMFKVPAGHYWTPETGLVKYYNPDWDSDEDEILSPTPATKYATGEQCKKKLEEAVIARCMADVEVGLLLSGGLDSSIIGGLMLQHNVRKHLTATKGKLKSFAVGQEGSPDILAARAVSKFLGTDHYEAIFTPDMAFDVLEKIVWHMETYEPELIRSCIPNYFLAKKAAEHVKVVITGEGSDEIWSGYLYYSDCDDPILLQRENRRILKAVQVANLQRADRMTMAHSLEARVPFFDVDNIATVMRVDPSDKLITEDKCEKYMLRKLYEEILPKEVVWRTKAMQCEGVGMTWVKVLQEHISANLVSDADFAKASEQFPHNTPKTKEEYYYRSIFEKHYPGCDKFVHVWEGGCRAAGAPW
eukprot:CAMPEP_0185737096 /NCGR_PEP_ID=MMETSP1171-20130828/29634_1 /TAXON_ID=374046 /ORGANISM="Helicotheca tamensis, Strain CCMP826" /LENGTH=540 /DNA_ID=CAMNT_0028407933 /DNA_START=50 /DNA_END=1669 /DNA_ORIENTATION=+